MSDRSYQSRQTPCCSIGSSRTGQEKNRFLISGVDTVELLFGTTDPLPSFPSPREKPLPT